MDEIPQNSVIAELMYQVKARKALAYERRDDYFGNDPIKSLPLSDYLRGLVDGRLEGLEFVEKLIPEVINLVIEKLNNENTQQIS